MNVATFHSRNFLLHLQERAGYDVPVLLKEPANERPTRSHLDQLHNEYVITKKLTDVAGVRPVYAKEGTESHPVLIMEYIQGQSLAELIRGASLDLAEKLRLAVNVTTVLSRIHEQQVMHKDMSSSNILVAGNDQPGAQDGVYVIDFGIASVMQQERVSQLTADDTLVGTLEIENEVGRGSLFQIRLPAEIAEAADVQTPIGDKPRVIGLAPTDKTWRILVADDNRENLLLLKSLLEEVGFFVIEAKNGKEAVEAFKKESPDLIWMDMRMPVIDGYEAVRHIRQCSGGDTVPIIAITASAFKEQRPDILAAGCDDMVFKPFQAEEIFEAMARQLDIKYFYKEMGEEALQRERINLTAEMLAGLPPELNQELRQTVLALDREAIFAVIERIEPMSPDTAKGLRILMDNFQTGLIGDLLGEVKG